MVCKYCVSVVWSGGYLNESWFYRGSMLSMALSHVPVSGLTKVHIMSMQDYAQIRIVTQSAWGRLHTAMRLVSSFSRYKIASTLVKSRASISFTYLLSLHGSAVRSGLLGSKGRQMCKRQVHRRVICCARSRVPSIPRLTGSTAQPALYSAALVWGASTPRFLSLFRFAALGR